jgi:hypothetical protein
MYNYLVAFCRSQQRLRICLRSIGEYAIFESEKGKPEKAATLNNV